MAISVRDLARLVNGVVSGDETVMIERAASLEHAGPGDLAFIDDPARLKEGKRIKAGAVIVPKGFTLRLDCPVIASDKPKLSFAIAAGELHTPVQRLAETHPTAVISRSAAIGKDVFIGAFCSVGDGTEIGDGTQIFSGARIGKHVKIGDDCMIHNNVVISDGCVIGSRVSIKAGAVIGSEGFGFVRGKTGYVKFPQIGTIVIEDDVEVGANSCIDRGALGETRIGKGTKIDNLVQIAHNVSIGRRVVIASQTGISGSVTIEDDCLIAGQVGFADHVVVSKGSVIGAKSAVFPGKRLKTGAWSGIPVQPMDVYKKQNAHIRSVPRIKEQIKKLAAAVEELKKILNGSGRQ